MLLGLRGADLRLSATSAEAGLRERIQPQNLLFFLSDLDIHEGFHSSHLRDFLSKECDEVFFMRWHGYGPV